MSEKGENRSNSLLKQFGRLADAKVGFVIGMAPKVEKNDRWMKSEFSKNICSYDDNEI